jgi:hypothetical protein
MISCLSVFSVGGHIRVWILLQFVISRDAVLWPLVDTVCSHLYHISFCHFSGCGPLAPGWYSVGSHSGCGPLTPGWYSVGSHLYYILLFYSSGCGPLAPSWYSVCSNLYYVLFYHFTGSYLLLAIWQLKTYLSVCFYFVRWIIRFSRS